MKRVVSQPFMPYITLQQVYDFDKNNPATSTGSPFIDVVLSLFSVEGMSKCCNIARYLKLKQCDVSSYLFIATGYRLPELRRLWVERKIREYEKSQKFANLDEMARALGFSDHSGIWHILHAEETKRFQRENERRRKAALPLLPTKWEKERLEYDDKINNMDDYIKSLLEQNNIKINHNK